MRIMLLFLFICSVQLLSAQSQGNDPYRNFNFQIVLNGGTSTLNFQEVSGLGLEQDAIEYRSGEEAGTVRKMPGMQKFSNVTLKRGTFAHTPRMTNYFKAVSAKRVQKETMILHMVDKAGTIHRAWRLTNAIPLKYKGANLNASGNEVAMEELTIAHEGLRRVQ